MSKITIFGAKSIALGTYHAIHTLYPEQWIDAFLVTSKENNPDTLVGLAVVELSLYEDKEACVLIATPENVHEEIVQMLDEQGFHDYVCIDSRKEALLMEKYYEKIGEFASAHTLQDVGKITKKPKLEVYVAKFYKDQQLKNTYDFRDWQIPIQVGAVLTDVRVTDICDNVGENISAKNVNYCELTALYWIWKNRLNLGMVEDENAYYGLFHYRRVLDMSEEDIQKMVENDVDVILPFPMMCEPDIMEHHTRYIKEEDWNAMLQALRELEPDYADAYEKIFPEPYMYNYNMIIAKRQVLADYCAWLFPILERTEELSSPRGSERADRYIGYMGENLLTLYFMYHQKDLKIYHTGRLLLV